jgi:hypothetical protein
MGKKDRNSSATAEVLRSLLQATQRDVQENNGKYRGSDITSFVTVHDVHVASTHTLFANILNK